MEFSESQNKNFRSASVYLALGVAACALGGVAGCRSDGGSSSGAGGSGGSGAPGSGGIATGAGASGSGGDTGPSGVTGSGGTGGHQGGSGTGGVSADGTGAGGGSGDMTGGEGGEGPRDTDGSGTGGSRGGSSGGGTGGSGTGGSGGGCGDEPDASCGLNGRGVSELACVDHEWISGSCDDPDECTDDSMGESTACFQDLGTLDPVCSEGHWRAECYLPDTYRVNVSSAGVEPTDHGAGDFRGLSADGRFVAFESADSHLVENDSNDLNDVFVHDLELGTTRLISVGFDGAPANGFSSLVSLSADGRFAAFRSGAGNLVEQGDPLPQSQIFVSDLRDGGTELVSVHSDSTPGDDHQFSPELSGDGRFVAFYSTSTNLVDDDTNGIDDVFVHDRIAGTTERVSVHTSGAEGNGASTSVWISGDGNRVLFLSKATNLVDDDTNGVADLFLRDRALGTTERVSLSSAGEQANNASLSGAISADGRFVAFHSVADNLVEPDENGTSDIFVRDLLSGTTQRGALSNEGEQPNDYSSDPALSADGRFVAFDSRATNLVVPDTNSVADVFIFDRQTGQVRRVSDSFDGSDLDAAAYGAMLSAGGGIVTFLSHASNLVEGDTNQTNVLGDLFVVSPTW